MNGFAFAAPRVEEITKTVTGIAGAGVTGLAEGVVIKMASGFGALQPLLTWGTLIGVPLGGVLGALFLRGMIGDLFQGVADGGAAVMGYSLPALVAPYMPTAGKGGGGAGGGGAGGGVKQLLAGVRDAPQRAQAQARVGLEF